MPLSEIKFFNLMPRISTLFFIIVLSSACKATGNTEGLTPHLNGHLIGLSWTIPFIGILLSLALIPLISPRFWHLHYGKISLIWGLAVFIPLAYFQGFSIALYETLHTYLLEYIPFIIILTTLYTISGGIKIEVN